MAVAEMQRLVLVGNNKERKDLLRALHNLGCVEIDKTHEIEDLGNIDRTERKEEVQLSLAKLALAFDVIKDKKNVAKSMAKKKLIEYTPPKKGFLEPKPQIEFDEFIALEHHSSDLFADIDDISKLNNELIAIKSEEAKNKNIIASMSIYKDIDMNLSEFVDTKNVSVFLGSIPSNKREKLEETLKEVEFVAYEVQGDSSNVAVLVTCLKEKVDEVNEALMSFEFVPINSREEAKPADIIKRAEESNATLDKRRTELILEILKYEDKLSRYQLMYDYYTLENVKAEREENMKTTGTSYVLEAWVPKQYAGVVEKRLTESPLTLSFLLRDPEEGEIPPSFVMDNAVVTPYESVTNMFSVPHYGEVNPNPIMGFFFFLFFGIMVSDAGYGLLMTIATGVALWKLKPGKYDCSLIKILLMGGISTMFWGIMFGSYFGMTFHPIMFNPLDKPINMMILSIVLGLIQMLVGLGINAYSLFKQKKPLDAIFGVFSWYFLVLSIGFIMAPMLIESAKGVAWVKTTGIVLLVVGLLGLMVSGALHAKGFKKVTGAFGGLYGIVNFFSDLLSYTRLFGLGLATGVIGMVFNKIAVVMIDLVPVLGVVIAIVLLVVGHVFNLGINTLGAYVHNSRLQFIEFFGKFYEGGGRLFAPLGSTNKYYHVTVKDHINNDVNLIEQFEHNKK